MLDLLRYRHAQLWLAGHRLRRLNKAADTKRRARFAAVAARYAPPK